MIDLNQTLTAVSGILGLLCATGSVSVITQIDVDGEVRFRIIQGASSREPVLASEYEVLQDTFETWLKMNGGSVIEVDDGSILVSVGFMVPEAQLPRVTLVAQKELVANEFLTILSAAKLVGQSLGFQVQPGSHGLDYGPTVVIEAARVAPTPTTELSGQTNTRHTITPGDPPSVIKTIINQAMEEYLGL